MKTFDAIIVGAGQAGPPLAGRLTAAGMSIAFVERKLFGGTCVNTGCTPTKTMIASAYAARMAQRAAEYGVTLGNASIGIDMGAVIARREAIVSGARNGVEASLRNNPRCTVFTGTASFTGPHTMRVGEDEITAKQIFLNVGARAMIPDFPGVRDVPFFDNSSMLAFTGLPRHLVVVGGSYIGIEFGQMYRRFGSEVTIVERAPRLVWHEDEDVSAAIRDILEREGITVRVDAECIHLAPHAEGVLVGTNCNTPPPDIPGSHVLLAVGRTPNTQDLGVDRAGIAVDRRGYIVVDDELRTNVEGVYALGDCNGRGAFTHTAYNDYEIVAANLLDGEARRVSDRIMCYALYSDPPLARIGMSETEVRASGRPALMGTRPMTRVNRAREKGESLGFMKILVDAETKQILGASLLGVGCDEAVHSLLDVMYARAPYTTVTHAMHIHPTVSELLPTVLEDLKPLQ
ncbi:MAG TPA: FAD-containing oxidoreductase [Acidobacteriaceae bacterium]|nr:FAD-containing oxidoreductase [Acidobacteriaceae bacterium]